MAEIGEPFDFCGRIVEAYYSNPELDTVAIMWSDGEKNREYHVAVNEEDDQFQALLKEFDYDSINECTRKKHEIHRQAFRNAFDNYAREHNLYGEGDQEERTASVDLLFDFDPEDSEHKEELFKLKLKIFNQDVVQKSKARTKKTALRTAKTPVEVIGAYNSFTK